MTAMTRVEIECIGTDKKTGLPCKKRLGDVTNAVEKGYVIVHRRCRHCGTMNDVRVEASSR